MNNIDQSLIILETDRLLLRRLLPIDIPTLINLWSDPMVTHFMGGPREKDWLKTEFEQAAVDPFAERFDLWPTIEKENGLIVGHCGLLEKEIEGMNEIEINYIFAEQVWGRGFATEIARAIVRFAVESMKINKLVALIDPKNAASERVAMKIGMRMQKEIIRPGGAVRKVYIFQATK